MSAARPHPIYAIGLLAVALLLAIGAAGASSADAAKKKRAACDKWGKTAPTELGLEQARRTVTCLVNQKRRARDLPALQRDARLDEAAQRHNERMDGTGCFAHECPGESSLSVRLRGIGYLLADLLRWAFGENVAWGEGSRGTPRSVVAAWMNSPGHRDNILSKHFREIGVGFSPGTPSNADANGGIYTTDFGLAVD